MKKLFTLMALAVVCTVAKAQEDSTYTGKIDTIRVGNMIIIKDKSKADTEHKDGPNFRVGRHSNKGKLSNISTNWGVVDLGFSLYDDQTNYGSTGSYLYNRPGTAPLGEGDFKLRTGKSINVNIWFFIQRLNLIKHHVNLKYGLGLELNNYRYKTAVSYKETNPFVNPPVSLPIIFRDSVNFSKNKLAADYLTVPFMLNFSTNPAYENKGLSLSVGVSAGYLYSQRNKQVSDERGKRKNKGDYGMERFKFAYVGELGLGPVRLYGSYSPTSMYSDGLDMRPYTLGIRLSNW
ncbi:MAG: outer membrane beta-barrel protein [Bacteroidota bacterium]|nr:outer membrane beta-barrel protein [Ferruginibacter sp.]